MTRFKHSNLGADGQFDAHGPVTCRHCQYLNILNVVPPWQLLNISLLFNPNMYLTKSRSRSKG